MYHFASAFKLSAARCVIAKSGSTKSFLILFVPFLARLLVTLDKLDKLISNGSYYVLRQCEDQVVQEVGASGLRSGKILKVHGTIGILSEFP